MRRPRPERCGRAGARVTIARPEVVVTPRLPSTPWPSPSWALVLALWLAWIGCGGGEPTPSGPLAEKRVGIIFLEARGRDAQALQAALEADGALVYPLRSGTSWRTGTVLYPEEALREAAEALAELGRATLGEADDFWIRQAPFEEYDLAVYLQ